MLSSHYQYPKILHPQAIALEAQAPCHLIPLLHPAARHPATLFNSQVALRRWQQHHVASGTTGAGRHDLDNVDLSGVGPRGFPWEKSERTEMFMLEFVHFHFSKNPAFRLPSPMFFFYQIFSSNNYPRTVRIRIPWMFPVASQCTSTWAFAASRRGSSNPTTGTLQSRLPTPLGRKFNE